jgi:hypothetical protein
MVLRAPAPCRRLFTGEYAERAVARQGSARIDPAMKKLRSQPANDCGQPLANKAGPRRAGN